VQSFSDEVNSYSLNYRFGLRDDNACRPVVDKRRVRSLKCLYLCKCGVLLTSTWPQPTNIAPEMTRSQNHVTILASTACVEILSSLLTVRAIRERAFSHCSHPII
jgi:hypothetical protein